MLSSVRNACFAQKRKPPSPSINHRQSGQTPKTNFAWGGGRGPTQRILVRITTNHRSSYRLKWFLRPTGRSLLGVDADLIGDGSVVTLRPVTRSSESVQWMGHAEQSNPSDKYAMVNHQSFSHHSTPDLMASPPRQPAVKVPLVEVEQSSEQRTPGALRTDTYVCTCTYHSMYGIHAPPLYICTHIIRTGLAPIRSSQILASNDGATG